MSYQDFITENIAPYSATKIGVYNSSGVKVGTIPLTNLKPTYGARLYRFGILSDVHNQSSQTSENTEDLQRALEYFNDKQSVSMTCICGDITENGTVAELQLYQTNVNTSSPNTPVYTTTGNHDCTTSGLNVTNWKTYTGQERCFEITKNNDHFLFFGMNKYSLGTSGTPYLDTDIDWLESKLEEYRNQRCFVITHLFFPTRAGNLKNLYPSGNWLGGSQLTRLQALNDRYLNSIWFTGHSHWKWYLQKYQDNANIYRNNCGWNVHIPSCASPIDSDGVSTRDGKPLESEGAIIDVYDNYIDIRGMDLKNEKYLPIAQYRLDTTLVNIPAKTVSYTVTNTLANATNSNSTTSVTGGSSYTATITANSGYNLSTVKVTMGGTDITSSVYSNGVITISSVTGNIVITASGILNAYTVTNNLTNCTSDNSYTSVTSGSSYTSTITANANCIMNTITVTMGNSDITSSAVSDNNISISSVTGNIVITASAILNAQTNTYSLNPKKFSVTSGASTTENSVILSAANSLAYIGAQSEPTSDYKTALSEYTLQVYAGQKVYIKATNYDLGSYVAETNKVGVLLKIYDEVSNQALLTKDYIDLTSPNLLLTATQDMKLYLWVRVKASSSSVGITYPVTITFDSLDFYTSNS